MNPILDRNSISLELVCLTMQSTLHPTRSLPFTKIIRSTSEQTISAKLHYVAFGKTEICFEDVTASFLSSSYEKILQFYNSSTFHHERTDPRNESRKSSTGTRLDQLRTNCYILLFQEVGWLPRVFFHGKILNLIISSLMQGLDSTFHERFVFFARLDRLFSIQYYSP